MGQLVELAAHKLLERIPLLLSILAFEILSLRLACTTSGSKSSIIGGSRRLGAYALLCFLYYLSSIESSGGLLKFILPVCPTKQV